ARSSAHLALRSLSTTLHLSPRAVPGIPVRGPRAASHLEAYRPDACVVRLTGAGTRDGTKIPKLLVAAWGLLLSDLRPLPPRAPPDFDCPRPTRARAAHRGTLPTITQGGPGRQIGRRGVPAHAAEPRVGR